MTTRPHNDIAANAQGFVAEALRELPSATVQTLGLTFAENATESDITQTLERIVNVQQTSSCLFKFVLGDIWNALQNYGDKKAWVVAAYGEPQYANIKNCGYVAKSWALHRRQDSLSWSFFEATASFDRRTQDAYIRRWRAGGLTIKMIREEKAALRHGETKNQRNARWLKRLADIAEAKGTNFVEILLFRVADKQDSPDIDKENSIYCQDSNDVLKSPDVRTFDGVDDTADPYSDYIPGDGDAPEDEEDDEDDLTELDAAAPAVATLRVGQKFLEHGRRLTITGVPQSRARSSLVFLRDEDDKEHWKLRREVVALLNAREVTA